MSKNSKDITKLDGFDGFDKPESNYFKMPNIWTDITAQIDSLAEMKVVEYTIRHTWGFQEFGVLKKITTDEYMHGRCRRDGSRMDRGTGLSNKSVVNGLKLAVKHGLLIEHVDSSDGARIKKYYSPAMKPVEAQDTDSETVPLCNESNTAMYNLHTSYVDSTHLVCKDYIPIRERNLGKETLGKENNTTYYSGDGDSSSDSLQPELIKEMSLVPDTPGAQIAFTLINRDREIKKRRKITKFPTIQCKEAFVEAEDKLGIEILEEAVKKALVKGIASLPQIVSFISAWKVSKADSGALVM